MHPSWSRATLHATGFGSLPNQSGAFSVFQWLCGLSFSYTYHKPTCHKTGPVDTPHLYDFIGSNHELQFLCLLVEALLLPSSSLEYSCNAIPSTSASFLAFKAQSMCHQSYRMTSKSGTIVPVPWCSTLAIIIINFKERLIYETQKQA